MSLNLGAWYRHVQAPAIGSDIAAHFPTMAALVAEHDVRAVLELGVREGHSTACWLYHVAGRGQVWGVDLEWLLPPRARLNPIVGNDMDPDVFAQTPDRVDLLFIDSSHAYDHTVQELAMYGAKVKPGGVIVLHDTENEHPEVTNPAIADQEPFPVRRAAQEYAAAKGFKYVEHAGSYGLGVIYVT